MTMNCILLSLKTTELKYYLPQITQRGLGIICRACLRLFKKKSPLFVFTPWALILNRYQRRYDAKKRIPLGRYPVTFQNNSFTFFNLSHMKIFCSCWYRALDYGGLLWPFYSYKSMTLTRKCRT